MVRAKGKFDKKPKIKRKKLIFKNTLRKIKNKNRIRILNYFYKINLNIP